MKIAIDRERTREVLKGINLPPQPGTLVAVRSEMDSSDPDLSVIGHAVAHDLSVSAGVLKTVNSPFFGLSRKVSSIEEAVMLLGLTNVVNIVTSLSLREAMVNADYPAMDRFFDTANDVASVAAALAKELGGVAPDEAYTLGLFQDCGIPLLMQKYSNYKEILRDANQRQDRSLPEVEDEHLGTNHTVVGYYVSRTWGLPANISHAIINHHRLSELVRASTIHPDNQDEARLCRMVALLILAEHISYAFRERTDAHDWQRVGDEVLDYLDLTHDEFVDLEADMFERLTD